MGLISVFVINGNNMAYKFYLKKLIFIDKTVLICIYRDIHGTIFDRKGYRAFISNVLNICLQLNL